MQTKAKSNSVITHERLDNGNLVFHVLGAGDVIFDPKLASDANNRQARDHGWVQRISDKAALGFMKEEGRFATAEEKRDAMQGLVDHLHSGSADWNMRVASGEPAESGLTYAALAQVKGWDISRAKESVAKRAEAEGTDVRAQLTALRKSPAIIEAIAAIKVSRLPESVNTDLGAFE